VKGESERRLLIVTLLATLTAGRLHGGRDPDYEGRVRLSRDRRQVELEPESGDVPSSTAAATAVDLDGWLKDHELATSIASS